MEITNKELHRVSITAIIYNEDSKFLVTQRSFNKKAFPGKWTVPGGGLSTDDYVNTEPSTNAGQWYNVAEKGLRREVLEEVGLEIEELEYVCDLAFIMPDGTPSFVFSYSAKYKSGEVKLDEDTIDYKWVTLEEAKEMDLIDGIWDEIKIVADILEKKN